MSRVLAGTREKKNGHQHHFQFNGACWVAHRSEEGGTSAPGDAQTGRPCYQDLGVPGEAYFYRKSFLQFEKKSFRFRALGELGHGEFEIELQLFVTGGA
jgi:hypothetical protein